VAPPLGTPAPTPPPAPAGPFSCLAVVTRAEPSPTDPAVSSVEVAISSRGGGAPSPCCAPPRLQFFAPGYARARTARAWTPDGDGAALAGGMLSGVLDGTLPVEGSGAAAGVAYTVEGGAGGGRPAAVAVNGVPCALA
jgi:hypothetical protein